MIHVDIRPAIKAIRKLSYDLDRNNFRLAVSRALNHTIKKAKTSASREIKDQYNIRRVSDVKKSLRVNLSSREILEAQLIATGSPMPLIAFRPRQIKKGVSVQVFRGQRKRIKKAFIATMRSGHTGVFARGRYSSDGFVFRYQRARPHGNDLPITELKTTSIPGALSNDVVLKNLTSKLNADFPNRLQHEVSRLRLG